MKNKHEQLYVAVQNLLIELDISPKKLRFIATQPTNSAATFPGSKMSRKTAQKLIDADLIVEEINWRKPGNVFDPHQEPTKMGDKTKTINSLSPDQKIHALSTFNSIKQCLPLRILWEYLREEHPDFLINKLNDFNPCQKIVDIVINENKNSLHLSNNTMLLMFNRIKSSLHPKVLWEYLQKVHPEFLQDQIEDYLSNQCATK